MAAFVPHAGRAYAEGRNTDLGPGRPTAVSGLAPYHRHRLVLETETLRAVLDAHGLEGAAKFVEEVAWRTYWKGWLEMRPAIWHRYRASLERDRPAALERAIAQAEAGETGIEGFDDWARELVATGFLHNHARMWFASIWIFTLRLPWEAGADFFLRHLMCGDPASNTLCWRWVAGLQTSGKTYLATRDNIARFTGGRFAPAGLAAHAEPLLEESVPDAVRPDPLPSVPPGGGRALLLVTEDDLSPESWAGDPLDVAGALVASPSARSPRPTGRAAAAFADGAAEDARTRAAAAFGVPATRAPISASDVVRACEAAGARRVVLMRPPVGPARDAWDNARVALAREGLELVELRRSWDAAGWPLATRGFFAFRKALPSLLAREGLAES